MAEKTEKERRKVCCGDEKLSKPKAYHCKNKHLAAGLRL